jgi:hypothetical protein
MFTSSGVGVLTGGSLAQLEMLSTELNLRSDNGRCRLTVALRGIRMLVGGSKAGLETCSHVNKQMRLEHKLIYFPGFIHDLFAIFW